MCRNRQTGHERCHQEKSHWAVPRRNQTAPIHNMYLPAATPVKLRALGNGSGLPRSWLWGYYALIISGSRSAMLKAVDSASNFIRAVVSLIVTGIVGTAGWLGYETYYAHDLAMKDKEAQLAKSQAEIESLSKDLQVKQR